jgi:predicted nucleotide-binding protein
MKELFSNHLIQFIDSVDILEESDFKRIVGTIIEKYLKNALDINHIKIMRLSDYIDENSQVLIELFSNRTISLNSDFKNEGQMPFAFNNKTDLWILPTLNHTTLNDTKEYLDKWNNIKNIPDYKTFQTTPKSKTSIIIPIYHDFRKNQLIGVVNFESNEYIEPTKIAKQTLKNISKVISKAIRLDKIRKQFQDSTTKSLNKLEDEIGNITLKLTKPKFFLGYSDKAADDAIGCIKFILDDQYPNDVKLCDWETKSNPGQITKDLFEDIHQSTYGIFYLSEKNEKIKNEKKYKDNRNVAFESGLFQGRDNPNWILIREKDSEKIPFDFHNFRRIDVPRDSSGEINKAKFREELKNALKSMIDI